MNHYIFLSGEKRKSKIKSPGRRNSNFVSLLAGRSKVNAKCLDSAQAVQRKLDYHVMPSLEAEPIHFSRQEKA